MNTQQPYRRRVGRVTHELGINPVPGGGTDVATPAEPSKPGTPGQSSGSGQRRTVAWVRVSELHAVLGSRIAGRGIDLQSELARRARRAPSAAAASRVSTLGHPWPSVTPGEPSNPSDRTEGQSL